MYPLGTIGLPRQIKYLLEAIGPCQDKKRRSMNITCTRLIKIVSIDLPYRLFRVVLPFNYAHVWIYIKSTQFYISLNC